MHQRLRTTVRGALAALAFLAVVLGVPSSATADEGPNLIGSILDSNGAPIEGVDVTVTGPEDFSAGATSDEQGTFVVSVPGPGDYRVTVDAESLPEGVRAPERLTGPGANAKVTSDGSGTVTLDLPRDESVTGTLRNGDEPLEGVKVAVEGTKSDFSDSDTSDKDGKWEVFLPEPGRYQVSIDTDALPEDVTLREGTKSQLTVPVARGQQRSVLFSFGESGRNVLGFGDRALQLLAEGLRFGLLLSLAAVGLSLVFGTTGLVNFAHGEMITLGAVLAFAFNVKVGLPLVLAAVVTVAIAAAAGAAQELGLWRPLRRRKTGLIAMMIVTIGLSLFARFVYLFYIGGQPRSYDDYVIQAGIDMGPITLAPRDFFSMGIAIVALLGVAFTLIFTRVGKAMRAVSDNPSLAAASGINVDRVILFVWVAGGGLAALGGVLLGLSQQVKFDMGFTLLLLVFSGVILGGLGTAFGALAGSIVVGMVVTVSTLWIPSELKNAAAYAALILILLVRPQGILGRSERVG